SSTFQRKSGIIIFTGNLPAGQGNRIPAMKMTDDSWPQRDVLRLRRLLPSQACCTIRFSRWRKLMPSPLLAVFGPNITLPDTNAGILMLFRLIHFLAGITWIGLLYFFNLVNVPFMKEIDTATKGKVVPALMPRALWWFRMSAVITVLAGLLY